MDVVPPNRDTATTHAPGVSLGGRLVADMGATNGRASPWCPRVTRRKRTALPATLGSGCKQDAHGRPGRQVREGETKAEETSNARVGRGVAFEGNVGEVWAPTRRPEKGSRGLKRDREREIVWPEGEGRNDWKNGRDSLHRMGSVYREGEKRLEVKRALSR